MIVVNANDSTPKITILPKINIPAFIDGVTGYELEFIDDDELVEVTPKGIRIRKMLLKEHERKRA